MPDRLLYFDLETTGTDPWRDKIVEFSFVEDRQPEAGGYLAFSARVNPRRPIPPEATEVHGIADADVLERPSFGHYAEQIQELVTGATLVGYNSRKFDTILLHQELRGAGRLGLLVDEHDRIIHPEIDLLEIWRRAEPRNLATAVRRFAGVEHQDAHSALADTEALPAVLSGMADVLGFSESPDRLREMTVPADAVDRDRKFVRDEHGAVLINIGKEKGTPVHQAWGFLEWMLGKDFSPDTKGWVRTFLAARAAGKSPHQVR